MTRRRATPVPNPNAQQTAAPIPSGRRVGAPHRAIVTAQDVAAEAGVSQSTVSRVVNNSAKVDAATRDRVEAAMARLGYVPNAAARSLITRRTRLLGLVVSNITNGFYPEIIEAITATALEHGYTVVVGSAGDRPESQSAYLRALAEQRIDGAILTSTLLDDSNEVVRLSAAGLPIVLANRVREDLAVDSVGLDNIKAGYLATNHLIEHGRRRIAFVGGRPDAVTNRDRYRGYVETLTAARIGVDPGLVVGGEFTWASGHRWTNHLLASTTLDAIVAADDTTALGCLDALSEADLVVGKDIAVVGFDDIAAAGLRAVSLTTIGTSARQMGITAVSLLLDRIRDSERRPAQHITLEARLVVRRTCGCQLPLTLHYEARDRRNLPESGPTPTPLPLPGG